MINLFRLIIICLLAFNGCASPKVNRTPQAFANQIAPLSAHNPYVGSNLYISKMMEQSKYFYNFIATQGAPLAISVNASNKPEEQVVNLYYPNNTLFIAEAELLTKNKMQWFVRGPYQSNWRYAKALNYITKDQATEPAIHVFGEAQRFRNVAYSRNANPVRVIEPIVPPEPKIIIKEIPVKVFVTETEESKKAVKVEKKEPESKDPLIKLNGSATAPLNTDQQALLISEGYARRDNNGDLIHTITASKEKFIAIVHWYTGSTDNTTKIKLANKHIEDIYQMPIGTQVRIPLAEIKEFKQMPMAANVIKDEKSIDKLREPEISTEEKKDKESKADEPAK